MKVLTTAVFAVIMLSKRLVPNQWRALFLLVLAAILIEGPAQERSIDPTAPKKDNNLIGVLAVTAMTVTSGFSGVYFEKVLKQMEGTIWERNFQLSGWSIIFGAISTVIFDGKKVLESGFFGGYSWAAVAIVFTAALGGLLTAVVMKYTDNIVKGFATAIAICLTSILSVPLLGAHLNVIFWCGLGMVVTSIFNYGDSSFQKPPQTLPK